MKLALSFSLLACLGLTTATPIASGAEFAEKEFDYIVVGGGLAGLVVANRLSENSNVRVGVIEAGRYFQNDPLINTPGAVLNRRLQMNATYDWRLSSAPQKHLNDRVLPLPRGKALGGSSAIGLLIFNRGSKPEYDAWERLGNSGWNWEGLLPFMKKAERFESVEPIRASVELGGIPKDNGRSGLIAGSYNTLYNDPTLPYRAASIKVGIPPNYDPDSGTNYGIQNAATSTNRSTGIRSYAANTYYKSAADRSNLVVLTEAQATKVELEHTGAGATARGVSFVHQNKTYTAKVKKEVILSAGSFLTPQLLELSGIGNSQILNKYGITPKVDLPSVGENYQDHVLISTTYELKQGLITYDTFNYNATFAAQAQVQYESTHDGPLTISNSILSYIDLYRLAGSAKIAYMHRKFWEETGKEKSTPLQQAQYKIQELWLRKKIGNVEIILNPGYFGSGTPKNNTAYISIIMCIQHPFSRGNIHVNSSNPLAPPVIDPNYFSKSIDRDILVQSVKFADEIAKTAPLAPMLVTRQDPSPETKSDEDITNWVVNNTRTLH
ncbi:unnamed protein product, partial [Rhizoctonia solani]